jgi:hypothetical protein
MNKQNKAKILVIVMITIVSLAGFYMYSYKQLYQKHIELKGTIATTEQQLIQYQNIQKQVVNYQSDIKELNYEDKLFRDKFPSDIFQEDAILLTNRIIDTYGKVFDIKSGITFSEVGAYSKEVTNLIKMKVELGSFTFKNYSAFKEFMNKITQFEPKIAIEPKITIEPLKKSDVKSITADPEIEVNLEWSFLGYKDNTKHENLFKYGDIEGNPNIFAAFKGMAPVNPVKENNNDKVGSILSLVKDNKGFYSNYDFYVVLSPTNADIPSIVVGKSGDGTKSAFQDINGIGDVELKVERRADGKYYFKYKTGKYNYPFDYSKMEEFTPSQNGKIVLLVRGNEIKDSSDNVGAKINVYNSTDVTVDVVLTGNSQDHDKIKVVSKQGKVETFLEN